MNPIVKILLGLASLFIPYLLATIDVETGAFGGGPGDANIGLGLIGLLIWAVGAWLIYGGFKELISKHKSRKR